MAARLFRLFWLTVLVGTAILAILWWWLQAGGFPVGHPRFWSNTIAPIAALALSLGSLRALHRESTGALRLLLPIWPAAGAAIAVAGRVLFPTTLAWLWLVPAGGAALMALAAVPVYARPSQVRASHRFGILGSITLAVLAGAGFVCTQNVPAPSTHPLNLRFPELERASSSSTIQAGTVRLDGGVLIQSFDGSITAPLGRLTMMVDPILTFSSRSPDGCPTLLVGAHERAGAAPFFRDGCRDGDRSCSLVYDLRGQGPAFLGVHTGKNGQSFRLEAVTRLERPVYSHLNSFCDVEVRGHRQLSLEFSPCAGVAVEVRPFDYPMGRPARFAFLDRDGTFRVVEATSGEKGPYSTLASGRMGRDESLSITLYDRGHAEGTITLADWARQADTNLSPTAGWGVPANAIEFSLSGNAPGAPASIFVTLAGTSVGRGWDCVGHSAGTYRNRILFEKVEPH